ncbi:FtsX-like permease family protein [Streptomyces sp. XY431]|uniref:FtsX-like permease family protein n=1 Tax=Streptomyces sp. XY431 TaxID=1415562 RepID=UPI0006AF992B|nr:FtsX-like permease family protein [Streptomyces sp. XY431]
MLRIALKSLRARRVSLLGAFLALALGVATTAAMLLGLAAATDPARTTGSAGGADLTAAVAALGTAAGVSAFVSAFVVASTYSFAVAQRRRELGLLRLAGATRAQVRRTVLAEALLLGAAASATGCLLGRLAAPALLRWLSGAGLVPPGLAVVPAWWPLPTAFGTGLLVALAGVFAAARRAGRTGPLDALRAADLDTGVLTAGRLLIGLGLLLTAAALAVAALVTDPADLLHRKTWTTRPMWLIASAGLLSPLLAPPLVRVLGRTLPARLTGYAGRLVRANAVAALRRTGAVAAPVLVAVALTGSLAGALDTVGAARTAEEHARTGADLVVVPAAGPVGPLLAALRAVPGVAALSATGPTALSVVEPDGVAVSSEARAVTDPAGLAALSRLPLLAGSTAALDDGSLVLPAEWGHTTVGEPVPVVRADGSRATLRVAAVLRDGLADNGLYVTAANAPGARPDRVDLRLSPGPATTAADVRAAVRAAVRPYDATVATREEWLAAAAPDRRTTRLRLLFLLVPVVGYTGIALANTLLMATADRRRELALLRLAGATRAQVVRLVTAEAVLVAAVGAVLGGVLTAVQLGSLRAALAVLRVPAPFVAPWQPVGAVAVGALLLAAVCAAPAAAWALRREPVDAAAR